MSYVIKVWTKYKSDKTGKESLLPTIFTENGILISHLRYLSTKTNRSQSWRERSIFALTLLIKYINANQSYFVKTTDLLKSFSEVLTAGTINPSTLDDPSQLYWSPRKPEDAENLLALITTYTDYLSQQRNYESSRINPFRNATSLEQKLNWCAYYNKNANVFLSHLTSTEDILITREVKSIVAPLIRIDAIMRYPETEIEIDNLLYKGFIRPNSHPGMEEKNRYDYKNQAITLLMHYGGLRKSEVFQLYIDDIIFDTKKIEAVVRVHHPSFGSPPEDSYKTRKEFLSKRYQLIPRTDYPLNKRQHCGWKAPLLTDKRGFFQVVFCPPDKATDFLNVWSKYLKYQRIDPPNDFDHPYAFTNTKGHPESIKNFQRLHKNANHRIGLEHKKHLGTTEHGHRYSYGTRLAQLGLNEIEIQKCMHHKSPESCRVYTQPTNSEIRKKMIEIENND